MMSGRGGFKGFSKSAFVTGFHSGHDFGAASALLVGNVMRVQGKPSLTPHHHEGPPGGGDFL